MANKRWFWLAFVGFLLARLLILKFPPPFYSDVFHDYRRYAEMWASGIVPYFQHLYEYPPATLPVLYLPEVLNRLNIGHYYENYRFQIFVFDLILFLFIFKVVMKLPTKALNKALALGFYIAAPLVAKDFFYEGIDWLFIGTFAIGLIYLSKRFWFWLMFWLSTAIKLLTAPLVAIFAGKDWKKMILTFVLIWGLPLLIFRTSLGVMFVYNNARGIKYAAFPSFVVETINYFTHTETRRNQPPDFEFQGPVSDMAEKVVGLIYPLSILAVIIYGRRLPQNYRSAIKISLVYFLTTFFTAKIFSQPFHLWLIPLIALYPFKSTKLQLSFIALVLWLLIIDTTPWIKLPETIMVIDPIPLKFFTYLFLRFLPMGALLWLSIKKLPAK